MAKIPDIDTVTTTFCAEVDETGFFWRDVNTGDKCSAAQIVDDALDHLCDLLETEF